MKNYLTCQPAHLLMGLIANHSNNQTSTYYAAPPRTQFIRNLVLVKLLMILLGSLNAYGGIQRYWVGTAGNANWSNPANWAPAGVPQTGDALDFTNTTPSYVTNDIVGLSVSYLYFYSGFTVVGNSLAVDGGITYLGHDPVVAMNNSGIILSSDSEFYSTTANAGLLVNCPINLNGNELDVYALNGANVLFRGSITGLGSLHSKEGTNYLSPFQVNNAFNGPVVVESGTLWLGGFNGYAVPSQLVVNSLGSAILETDYQIADTASVTLYAGGHLLVNGRTTALYNLVMTNIATDIVACTVDTGNGGFLGINGSLIAYNDSPNVTPTLQGTLSLNIFNPIWTWGSSYAALDVPAALVGNGFSKGGNSAMIIRGANSFTGGVEVDQGALDVRTTGALGSASGVLLYGSGTMTLSAMISGVTLDVQGTLQPTLETGGSSILSSGGSWNGPIILHTNLVVTGGDTSLNGVISGPGGLDFRNLGTAVLGGSSANTFSGSVRARGTLLELGKPSNVRALNGPLIVGGGSGPICEVRWLNNYQDYYNPIYTTPTFTLYPDGYLNVNNHIEVLGPITFNGGTLDSGPNGLVSISQPVTVNPASVSAFINGLLNLQGGTTALFTVGDGPADCDLLVNAVVQGTLNSPYYFVKQGPGKMCLENANTYDAVTLLQQGTLEAVGSSALGTSGAGSVISGGATLRLVGFNGYGSMAEGIELSGAGVGGVHGVIEVVSNSTFVMSGNLLLDASTTIKVDSGSELRLLGPVFGTGPLTFTGGGIASLEGTSGNSYSGDTIVSQGTLWLGKPDAVTAVPGSLFIGSADGMTTASAVNLNNYQIIASIVVYPGSTYNINNFQENTGFLVLYGNAAVTTGNGGYLSLVTGGDIYVYPTSNSTEATISGVINLDPGNHHFYVGTNNASRQLFIPAAINQYSSTASIEKTGPGTMWLAASNNYLGNTYVTDGTLVAGNASALGVGAATTTVSNAAMLELYGGLIMGLETLVLNSSNPTSLESSIGSNVWTGPIGLYQPTGLGVDAGYLQVLNQVSGTGGLTKRGNGRLQFWGYVPNTYSGGTTVNGGVLEAGRVNQVSIPGDVTIGDDSTSTITATLQIDREQQFSSGANVNVRKSGYLLLNSNPNLGVPVSTVGTLSGSGTAYLGPTNASFTVNNTANCVFSGSIGGSGSFAKSGNGTMQLTGVNYFNGPTTVSGGLLLVDGGLAKTSIQVSSGALGGTGATGPVTLGGTGSISPGDGPSVSPGILNVGNFSSGASGTETFQVELNGPNPGSGYDQLSVQGTVNLGNRLTLNASLNFSSWLSNTFTIIKNDGNDPVLGTFRNLSEGSTISIGGQQLVISYVGGDGNDVVLTQITGALRPSLTIQPLSPSSMRLSWPTNDSAYTLQSSTDMAVTNWTAVTPPPVIVNGSYVVTDATSDPVKFYRLIK
jgi:autotransporter-associated beta strand protein